MGDFQLIKSNQQSKYDEIIEYLKQDDSYWLENDKWDINDIVFDDVEYKVGVKNIKLDFIEDNILMNEVKFYLVYSLKNKYLTLSSILNEQQYAIKYLVEYMKRFNPNTKSFRDIKIEKSKWKLFLIDEGISLNKNNEIHNSTYRYVCNTIPDFIKEFYDDREEIEKDVWYAKNIKGAKIPASGSNNANNTSCMDFTRVKPYYRNTVKKYFVTIITKKSYAHCKNILDHLVYFINKFYANSYIDGFIENLSRQDIENYLMWLNIDYKEKNQTRKSKFVSYIRTFLEYIQVAQYDKAPKKEVSLLIFQDDIPRREQLQDEMKRVKFIPEPILKQIDNNIMELDRLEFIPVYILLRETGWRGTDILNLRYDNCLEQIWNNKEQVYNYYLCGEITKTGIAQLKIPIRDKVA